MTAKVAILIDGAYYLRRLRSARRDIDASNPQEVSRSIGQLINSHLSRLSEVHRVPNPRQLLYRCFYYDAWPYSEKGHTPISKRAIDYSKSDMAVFRLKLFDELRSRPNLALRLGQVTKPGKGSWTLNQGPQTRLLRGEIAVSDLEDSDFSARLTQKGVDMRIGLDIATITLKKQANVIALVSGDSDFVPAAKLARREGVTFILDPLWQNVSPDLREHIDGLTSGFRRPVSRRARS